MGQIKIELRFSGSEKKDSGSEKTLQDGGGVCGYGWELGSTRKESGQVGIQTVQVRIKIIQVRNKFPTLKRGHQVGNQMVQVQQKMSGQKKTGRLEKRDTP